MSNDILPHLVIFVVVWHVSNVCFSLFFKVTSNHLISANNTHYHIRKEKVTEKDTDHC